uniref:Uncharacterized protein n=1 Tax=Oryza sativa subsp. japonica TaxID=39947 RepID=Q2QVJ1_ORYSJ|nr:hypothetical protein LOC_Os12g12630 [Oryza sativa Japonica Group]
MAAFNRELTRRGARVDGGGSDWQTNQWVGHFGRVARTFRLMVFNRMSKRVDPIGCFGGVDRFRWRYKEAQEVRVAAVCAFCVEAEPVAEIRVARGGVVLGGVHRSSGRSLRRRRRLPDEELASRTPAAELPGTTADSPRPAVRRLLAGPETQRRRLPEVGGRRLLAGLAQAGHRREAVVVGDGFGTEAAPHWGEARGGRERDRRVEEEIGSIWIDLI